MITKEQAEDIVRKFDFFYGCRSGRELWFSKAVRLQEEDLRNFRRDCRNLLKYLKNTESFEDVTKNRSSN